MKIVGITRIRNEAKVIGHTLDHLRGFCDEVYVLDDCSTDNSVEVCRKHPIVVDVMVNDCWEGNPIKRLELEGTQRQQVYERCLISKPDWVYYFDADEFIDFNKNDLVGTQYDSFKLKFFDYYITEKDKNKHFLNRNFCGREYREILTLFKPRPNVFFSHREPTLGGTKNGVLGKVKHYGKAVSITEWDKTCDYYSNHLYEVNNGVEISKKWQERKGKAIHSVSDFGTEFITWKDTDNELLITKRLK